MAKFGRYDPRNKKKDRNKKHSINKDLRIREVDNQFQKYSEQLLQEITYEEEEWEPKQLHG